LKVAESFAGVQIPCPSCRKPFAPSPAAKRDQTWEWVLAIAVVLAVVYIASRAAGIKL
jgi:hypothetical protein